MRLYLLCLLFTTASECIAGSVDTVSIYSKAMRKTYKCVVIKPDNYRNTNKKFETVYLLHGHSGNFSNWIKLVPQLKKYADDYQMLIVCPDGKTNGWYFDSPVADSMQFETYISKEVPAYIDANYKTVQGRNARAITGPFAVVRGTRNTYFNLHQIFGTSLQENQIHQFLFHKI